MKSFTERFRVEPGRRVDLSTFDTRDYEGVDGKTEGKALLEKNTRDLADLQYRLYAEDQRSLLVVLQGMDTAGKDGTIRHLMSGVNPQGVKVHSFKAPSQEELQRDFLWRIHQRIPRRGEIGIFNRSHYEDVLVVRVHDLVPKKVWSKRYEQINRFEEHLVQNRVTVLKFFLCISKDEQRERLQARLDNPEKNWKFNPGDLDERKRWDDYIKAYEAVLRKCSTAHAPWYIIPSDRKWFRNLAVSSIIKETLRKMRPKIPPCEYDLEGIRVV